MKLGTEEIKVNLQCNGKRTFWSADLCRKIQIHTQHAGEKEEKKNMFCAFKIS